MGKIRYVEATSGHKVYFLADDQGEIWLGGWLKMETAEERLRQAEDCDWDPDQMNCSIDVNMQPSPALTAFLDDPANEG